MLGIFVILNESAVHQGLALEVEPLKDIKNDIFYKMIMI